MYPVNEKVYVSVDVEKKRVRKTRTLPECVVRACRSVVGMGDASTTKSDAKRARKKRATRGMIE
jgi:hypothetical protein